MQRHYYKYLKGQPTSTNPMALIFAWSAGLRKRGELDGTPDVVRFADVLESAALEAIESGVMTGDLMRIAEPDENNRQVNTEEFLSAVRNRLERQFAAG